MHRPSYLSVACLAALLVALPAAAAAPALRVIVHPKQPRTVTTRKQLTELFLKRVVRWPDGSAVWVVDLPPTSPVRARFAAEVLGRSVNAVKSFWQQKLFSGQDVPPPELASEAAVLQFVLEHPGAVGYVGPDVDIGAARALVIQ